MNTKAVSSDGNHQWEHDDWRASLVKLMNLGRTQSNHVFLTISKSGVVLGRHTQSQVISLKRLRASKRQLVPPGEFLQDVLFKFNPIYMQEVDVYSGSPFL